MFPKLSIYKVKKVTGKYRKKICFLLPVLLLMLLCIYVVNKTVYIYHGPYAPYTPVDLQKKRQKKYNEDFSVFQIFKNGGFWLKTAVVKRRDLDYIAAWKDIFRENQKDGKKKIFSVNSYAWLCLAKGKVPCDTLCIGSGEGDTVKLRVIGYKKAERPYYLLRFITYKQGHFPSDPEEFSAARYILNLKEESGSTHVTPEIYLLENCGNILPSVLWESKSNMVGELVAGKPEKNTMWPYPVGAISDSEYNELLDEDIRKNLIVRDIMVNIPHDPLVIVDEVWTEKGLFGGADSSIVCKLLKKKGWMEQESERTRHLQKMYRYYVSLGILRKNERDEFYIHNPQYENKEKGNGMNILPDSLYTDREVEIRCHFFRTVYGNLEDHYYRFERDTAVDLRVKNGVIISGERLKQALKPVADDISGYRVYVGTEKAGETPVDSLIGQRGRSLYNFENHDDK